MLKELLKNIWIVKKEFFCILIVVGIAIFFTSFAQAKGDEKAILSKIEKWEKENYNLTDYRKSVIINACKADFQRADYLVDSIARCQPNFGKK